MRATLQSFRDNSKLSAQVHEEYNFKMLELTKEISQRMDEENMIVIALNNQIEHSFDTENCITINGSVYGDLDSIPRSISPFNSILKSNDFRKWIKKCYGLNVSYNRVDFESQNKFDTSKIVLRENVTQMNKELAMKISNTKDMILSERKDEVKRQKAQALALEYKQFGDVDVLCKHCYQTVFKMAQVKGKTMLNLMRIIEQVFI